MILNPHLVDRQLAGIQLEAVDSIGKSKAISQIKLIQGVVLVFDYHGRGLRVVFYHETERGLKRVIRLIVFI